MGKRELIYKDEARRAVLQHAPGIAWSINNIKPVAIIDDKVNKIAVQSGEYWIARFQYRAEHIMRTEIVLVVEANNENEIEFIYFNSIDGEVINSTQCARFELLEKVEVEKYK